MHYHTEDLSRYISDAIDMVSPWNLSDEEFLEAVHQQAQLMSGIDEYFHDSPENLTQLDSVQLPLDLH